MKKSIVIILTSLLVAPLPFSCNRGEIGEYKVSELGISVGKLIDISEYRQFEKILFDPAPIDTLNSSAFAMHLFITDIEYITQKAQLNAPLISSAMADEAPAKPSSKLSLISIYSNKTVYANGEIYEATNNLTSLFMARTSNYYDNKPTSVLKFIEDFNIWEQEVGILLILDANLDQPLAQKFKVIVTMDDGTVFELETEKVVVK